MEKKRKNTILSFFQKKPKSDEDKNIGITKVRMIQLLQLELLNI